MSTSEDVASDVTQISDGAKVTVSKQPKQKSMPNKPPKPPPWPKGPLQTVGYTRACPGWSPAANPVAPWTLLSLKEVEAERAEMNEMIRKHRRRLIVKVETTYTIVDDGGLDG